MKNKRGYTLVELLIVIFMGIIALGICGLIYAAIHFIIKAW